MNKEKIKVNHHNVILFTQNVELCIYVNKDLKKDDEALSHPYGWISDSVNRDLHFDFDNLEYFLDYNKAKQKETKQELKDKNVWEPGLNKEIKALIKEARRLKLF